MFSYTVLSCSIQKLTVKTASDVLTGTGSSDVFTSDDDPELVAEAIPFAMKLYETLLSQNPRHQGLLLTTGSLFVMYANAFVQTPAQLTGTFQGETVQRAKRLYLRGADMLLRGLEERHKGFETAYHERNIDSYGSAFKKADVPFIYWFVAGTMSAYSLDPFDLTLGIQLPMLKSLIDKAYLLEPDYNNGAIDDFYVLFYASLPVEMGGDRSVVQGYFQKAVEKSKGLSAGPYVSYAEAVCIPAQDYENFKIHLEKALAIEPDNDPQNRLINVINQRKARYLLDNAPYYFFELDPGTWEEWEEDLL
jgi:predicted anti-sigma-YlaC factor YlaD